MAVKRTAEKSAARTNIAARGNARRARTNARLAETVAEQLREHGYAGLTIERVAAESGVAKTTIYRRWASKAEMVFDLAIHRPMGAAPSHQPNIDTGSLEGDVRGLAERAVALVAGEQGRRVLPSLLADIAGDQELAVRLRQTFIDGAQDDIKAMFDRARLRGELTEEPPVAEFHAALLGIPYAHVHLLIDSDAEQLAPVLARQLLSLLRG